MKTITTVQLQQKLQANEKLNILDVRQPVEVSNGKIKGSENIPLGLLEFRMQELNKNEHYYVICHAGGRSAQAVKLLESFGYDVTNVNGGMTAWQGETI